MKDKKRFFSVNKKVCSLIDELMDIEIKTNPLINNRFRELRELKNKYELENSDIPLQKIINELNSEKENWISLKLKEKELNQLLTSVLDNALDEIAYREAELIFTS